MEKIIGHKGTDDRLEVPQPYECHQKTRMTNPSEAPGTAQMPPDCATSSLSQTEESLKIHGYREVGAKSSHGRCTSALTVDSLGATHVLIKAAAGQ